MGEPAEAPAERAPRLRARPLDLALIVFFALNVAVITYQVDLEQLVIADPNHFSYPLWPPRFSVDATHWWGRTFDPLLLVRPVWWKVTIWVDAVFYGPFYLVAIFALVRDRSWIRTPLVFWAGLMLMGVAVIMGEEMFGPSRTPQPVVVWLANLPWIAFPLLVLWRAWLTRRHQLSEAPAASVPKSRQGSPSFRADSDGPRRQ